ncbi:MAG: Ig-like domain-containing protein [Gemmatimonadales bacterium]
MTQAARRGAPAIPTLLVVLVACTEVVEPPLLPAVDLVFEVEPTVTTAGSRFARPVQIVVRDSLRNAVTGFAGGITVSLAANPGGATLMGTTTVAARDGVATFDDLALDKAGAGYTLAAGAEGLAGATSTPFEVAPAAPRRMSAIGGDSQVAPAGTQLAAPLVVRVTDNYDNPIRDFRIAWAAEDGGSVSAAQTATDDAGVTSVTSALGPDAGTQVTTARPVQGGLLGAPLRFNAVAQIQGATQIEIAPAQSGNGQTDSVFATLALPYQVRVRDHNDVPVEGVVVTWTAGPGGSVSGATSATDASGIAQVTRTLGSDLGTYGVEASVPGLIGSPVEFYSIAGPGNPTTLTKVGGDDDQMRTVNAVLDPYSVRVTDSYGNGVSGVSIAWAVTSGGGSISVVTNPTQIGVATARHTLGPDEGTHAATATAGSLPGAPQVTFTSTAVTALVSVYDYYGYDGWFSPEVVVVPGGRTVGWTWVCGYYCGNGGHNVVFEDDPTEPVSSPTQVTGTHVRTFGATPTTIRYRCTNHSTSFTQGMVGVVAVTLP